MHKFKYEKEITEHFQDFNFDLLSEKEVLSYRWVFSDINDKRNFIPPYIVDKKRDIKTATGFALSFFKSKNSGHTRWKKLLSNKPELFKKLGTHIAEGTVIKSHGLCSVAVSYHHFDLFEYADVDLKNSFAILEKMS